VKKLKTVGIIVASVIVAMWLAYYLGTKVLVLSTSNAGINIDKKLDSEIAKKEVSQAESIDYYRIDNFGIPEYEKQGVVKMQRVDPTDNIVFVANPEKIEQPIPDTTNDSLNTNTTDTTVPIPDTTNDSLNNNTTDTTVPIPDTTNDSLNTNTTDTTVPIPDTTSSTQSNTAQTDKDTWVPYIIEQSQKHGLPPEWILAIIDFSGSEYNPKYKYQLSLGGYLAGVTGINSKLIPDIVQKLRMDYKEGMEFDAKTNIDMMIGYLEQAYAKRPELIYILAVYQNGFEKADQLEDSVLHERYDDYEKQVKKRADEWASRLQSYIDTLW